MFHDVKRNYTNVYLLVIGCGVIKQDGMVQEESQVCTSLQCKLTHELTGELGDNTSPLNLQSSHKKELAHAVSTHYPTADTNLSFFFFKLGLLWKPPQAET